MILIFIINACPFTFTYPLTVGVVRAPKRNSQPVSSIFLCSPRPLGTLQTPGLFFPDNVFPSVFVLSALSSSPFHCAMQDGFDGQETCPYHLILHRSLYNVQEIYLWSDCMLDLGTDFLIDDMIFA